MNRVRWAVFFLGFLAGAGLLYFHFREADRAKTPPELAGGPQKEAPAAAGKPQAAERPPSSAPAGRTVSLSGRVVRGDPPSPVEKVAVRLWIGIEAPEGGGAPSRETKSGPDGRFDITGIPKKAPLRIDVDEPSSALLTYRIGNPRSDTAGRIELGDFRLEAPLSLEVGLTGAEEGPLDGGKVSLSWSHPRNWRLDCQRDAKRLGKGRYLCERLPAENCSVSASAAGHVKTEVQVDLPFEGVLRLRLARGLPIAGTVRGADGEVIGGAEVEVSGDHRTQETRTDASGKFAFASVSPGLSHALRVRAEGYAEGSFLGRPGDQDLQLVLGREGILAGRVVTADGAPAPGATVGIEPAAAFRDLIDPHDWLNPAFPEAVRTDTRGFFEMRKVPPGRYLFRADGSRLDPSQHEPLKVGPGTRIDDLVLRLEPGLTVRGRVIDGATLEPVAKAEVELHSDSTSKSGMTDEAGRFVIRGVAEGPYEASAKSTARAGSAEVELGPGGVEDLQITLDREEWEPPEEQEERGPGGAIRGRVVDPAGRGVPEATIVTSPGSGSPRAVGQDGRFVLRGLEPGTYGVVAHPPGAASVTLDGVEARGGEETVIPDLVIGRGATFTARVVDRDGQPIRGAWLEVNDGKGEAEGFTDDGGRFEAAGLGGGVISVRVEKDGFTARSLEADLPAGEQVVRLERKAVLAGIVRAEGREAVSLGKVYLSFVEQDDREPDFYNDVWIDPTGRFRFDLPAGDFLLRPVIPGFAQENVKIALAPGERREEVILVVRPGGSIAGLVLAGERPAPGVQVSVDRIDTLPGAPILPWPTTGRDGRFAIADLPEGRADLAVDWKVQLTGVEVRRGRTAELTIRIPPIGIGSVRGTVSRNGRPLTGARVRAVGSEKSEVWAETDSTGRFSILKVAAGKNEIVVSDPLHPRGTYAVTKEFEVAEGGVADLDIDFDAVLVTGQLSRKGIPVEAVLEIEGLDQWRWRADTDSGRFSIYLPGPGDYTVRAIGYGGFRSELHVPEDVRDVRKDFEVPSGELAGRVADATSGEALHEASVRVLLPASNPASLASSARALIAKGRTDHQGRFRLDGIPSGRYALLVSKNGFVEAPVEGVEVVEGRSGGDRQFLLERGSTVLLRVTDVRGKPVSGALAVVWDPDGRIVHQEDFLDGGGSSGEGLLMLRGLRPGAHQAMIGTSGFAPARALIQVTPGISEQAVTLTGGGRLEVTALRSGGLPVEEARLLLLDDRGEEVWVELDLLSVRTLRSSPRTGPAGDLVLEHLPPGLYRLSATKGAERSGEEHVVIGEGQTAFVRLVFSE